MSGLNDTLFSNQTGKPKLPIQSMDLTQTEVVGRKPKSYKTMEDVEEEEKQKEETKAVISHSSEEVKIKINKTQEILIEFSDGRDSIQAKDLEEAFKELKKSLEEGVSFKDFNSGSFSRTFTLNIRQDFEFA